MKNKILYFTRYFIFLICFTSVNCSYVIDSIEASITNRSSFSINSYFDATNDRVVIEWEYADTSSKTSSEAFASYEVYVTEEIDDEYSGYKVIAAGYDIGDSDVAYDSQLQDLNTISYTFDVIYSGSSGTISLLPGGSNQQLIMPVEGGTIFLRIGLIEWKQSSNQDRDNNWEPLSEAGIDYYFSSDPEYFYENYSEIKSPSGYAQITIPHL